MKTLITACRHRNLSSGSGAFAAPPFVALWRQRERFTEEIQRFTEAFFSPQGLFESITPEYWTTSDFCLTFDVFKVNIWLEDKRSLWLSGKLIRVCFTLFCNIHFSLRNPALPHPADRLPSVLSLIPRLGLHRTITINTINHWSNTGLCVHSLRLFEIYRLTWFCICPLILPGLPAL